MWTVEERVPASHLVNVLVWFIVGNGSVNDGQCAVCIYLYIYRLYRYLIIILRKTDVSKTFQNSHNVSDIQHSKNRSAKRCIIKLCTSANVSGSESRPVAPKVFKTMALIDGGFYASAPVMGIMFLGCLSVPPILRNAVSP